MKNEGKSAAKSTFWIPTQVQNLYRHKGGCYYARFKVAGHTRWVALKTTVFSTAKLRLNDEEQRILEVRASGITSEATTLTFKQLAEIYTARYQADPNLSVGTKLSRGHAVATSIPAKHSRTS